MNYLSIIQVGDPAKVYAGFGDELWLGAEVLFPRFG